MGNELIGLRPTEGPEHWSLAGQTDLLGDLADSDFLALEPGLAVSG